VIQHSLSVAAVGTTRIINESYGIKSVKIDNPSGLWLYLKEAQDYVPPSTLGWVRSPQPTTSSITIVYSDALVGGAASVVSGGPITVTTYQITLPDSNGISYTAATAADIGSLETQLTLIEANTGVGGTLETNLAKIVDQTNPIVDIPGQGLYALTDTSIQALGGIQPNNASYILGMQNRGPNDVYVADTAFSTAALIRGNGWKIPTDGELAMTFASGVGLKATCAVGGTASFFAWTLTLTT
jgi:hypothetical protein